MVSARPNLHTGPNEQEAAGHQTGPVFVRPYRRLVGIRGWLNGDGLVEERVERRLSNVDGP
jgi:hypothetical protein